MSVAMWKMRNGDEIAIVKMEDSHLKNTVAMVQRNAVLRAHKVNAIVPYDEFCEDFPPTVFLHSSHPDLLVELQRRGLEQPPWLSYEEAVRAQALIDVEYLTLKPFGSSGLNSESAG